MRARDEIIVGCVGRRSILDNAILLLQRLQLYKRTMHTFIDHGIVRMCRYIHRK